MCFFSTDLNFRAIITLQIKIFHIEHMQVHQDKARDQHGKAALQHADIVGQEEEVWALVRVDLCGKRLLIRTEKVGSPGSPTSGGSSNMC